MTATAAASRGARFLPLMFVVLAIAGASELGQGAYIKAKAVLSQQLLRSAWEKTLLTGEAQKPWPWADSWPVARLQVTRLEIDLVVLEGLSGEALAFGPGQSAGLARPGEKGVALMAGHRDTHFAFLRHLVPGDKIRIETSDGGQMIFVVSEAQIVDSRNTRIRNDRTASYLILSTCYPFDALLPGGPLRYLVHARKI